MTNHKDLVAYTDLVDFANEPSAFPDHDTRSIEMTVNDARALRDALGNAVDVPEILHRGVANLVLRFASAMAGKLAAAQLKYGYGDGCLRNHWMDECRQHLLEHLIKGDPRDVANYCAFLWNHGESTPYPVASDAHKRIIQNLLALAKAVYFALDDSEELSECAISGQEDAIIKAGTHLVPPHGVNAIVSLLDELDLLPEPDGVVACASGKAAWALRDLLGTAGEVDGPPQPVVPTHIIHFTGESPEVILCYGWEDCKWQFFKGTMGEQPDDVEARIHQEYWANPDFWTQNNDGHYDTWAMEIGETCHCMILLVTPVEELPEQMPDEAEGAGNG